MNTNTQLTLTLARLVVSFVVASHGVQKLFGWFGGYGFDGTMGFFTGTIGLPYILGLLIILAETVGMLSLALGLFSRFLSAMVIMIMLGAVITVHSQVGYFMNWSGTLQGEGYEYHILAIALSAVVAINGGGAFALDNILPGIFARQKSSESAI